MADITVPDGFGIPLVDLATDLLPDPTMDALDARYEGGGGGGGAVDSVAGKTGVVVLVKADVGLADVDNTSDAAKPVSTAQATALAGKAATSHTHAEGDVAGLTAALAGKAPTVHTHTASQVTDFNTAADARVVAGITGKANTVHTHAEADVTGLTAALAAKAPLASPAFTGTPTGITKSHVGLANVDNTSDANKPVSTAQAAADALKANIASPTFTGTVSGITKTMVGLGNVDNTADSAKPVSTAQAAADALAIPKSLVDAKGDLLVASANDTPARLAVGTNGHVLTADSAEATGVKWAASAGGGLSGWPGIFGPPAGGYMRAPQFARDQTGGFTLTNGTAFAVPFTLLVATTLVKLGYGHWSDGSAGSVVRLGLYQAGTNGYPTTLIVDAGTVSGTSGATTLKTATISQVLSPGAYFAVIVSQGAPSTPPNATGTTEAAYSIVLPGATADTRFGGWALTGVTGALPGTYTAGATAPTSLPFVYVGA